MEFVEELIFTIYYYYKMKYETVSVTIAWYMFLFNNKRYWNLKLYSMKHWNLNNNNRKWYGVIWMAWFFQRQPLDSLLISKVDSFVSCITLWQRNMPWLSYRITDRWLNQCSAAKMWWMLNNLRGTQTGVNLQIPKITKTCYLNIVIFNVRLSHTLKYLYLKSARVITRMRPFWRLTHWWLEMINFTLGHW